MPSDYQPKCFDDKAFAIFIKVVEALIETGGNDALPPEAVARRMDEFLFITQSPTIGQMSFVLKYINNFKPWFVPRFGQFVNMTVEKRRNAIREFIGQGGIMRDIARGLKVMAVASYYSSPEGMAQTGFKHFDDRPDTPKRDQKLITHQDH